MTKIPTEQTRTFEVEIKDFNYEAARLIYGEDFFPKRPWYRRALQWARRLVR